MEKERQGTTFYSRTKKNQKNPAMQEHYSPASPDFIYIIFYSYRLIYWRTLINLYENIQNKSKVSHHRENLPLIILSRTPSSCVAYSPASHNENNEAFPYYLLGKHLKMP